MAHRSRISDGAHQTLHSRFYQRSCCAEAERDGQLAGFISICRS
jgi:hypothetical protein